MTDPKLMIEIRLFEGSNRFNDTSILHCYRDN